MQRDFNVPKFRNNFKLNKRYGWIIPRELISAMKFEFAVQKKRSFSTVTISMNVTILLSLYWFWKAMEIDNTVFQDLENFGKGLFLNRYGKVLDFCLGKF